MSSSKPIHSQEMLSEHVCVECGKVVRSLEPPVEGKDFICGPHNDEMLEVNAHG